MKLIDKSALVAEIERLKDEYLKHSKNKFCAEWSCGTLDNILSFLDTLEVKEVDLEKEIQDIFQKYKNGYNGRVICNETDFSLIAKHFFELGIKAKDK